MPYLGLRGTPYDEYVSRALKANPVVGPWVVVHGVGGRVTTDPYRIKIQPSTPEVQQILPRKPTPTCRGPFTVLTEVKGIITYIVGLITQLRALTTLFI